MLGASRTGAAVWVPLDNDLPSEVVRFASLSDCSAEPTGAYFDRTGKVMYVHVQHAGGALGNDLLVAITRDKAGH